MQYLALLPSGLLSLMLISFVTVCIAGQVKAENGQIEVKDDLGRVVVLEQPAQRIVALSPHIVENLFSAGLGSAIVAAVSYADYPDAAKSIPRLGGFANFSIESVVSFQPDLVIGWASGYVGFAELVKQLEQLGVPVYVDEPKTLSDVSRSIANMAKLGGTETEAQSSINAFNARLADLSSHSKLSALNEQVVKVFYPIWPKPLQTLNGKHIVSDVIQLCGGENIFQQAVALAPQVNFEAVLALNPDVIVASASDGARPDWLNMFANWPELSAVNNEHVYWIDGDLLSRHTVRMLEGTEIMCDYIANIASRQENKKHD